ncbi:hypothetical protein [Cobetia sp. 29-18-1]|uniref:hypothetical protein n=1 Tax=Cobetia sp. 29-18-1 TaxID=3040018 RepID=UPI00244BC27F|nr:hypothetical protein [Cobetia sp. 29-18-1]MDH2299843.1 hypothetical protein [Cobetia sp. 29-18-1]
MNLYSVLIPKDGCSYNSFQEISDRVSKEYSTNLAEGFQDQPEVGKFDSIHDIYYICYKRKGVSSSGVSKTRKSTHSVITTGNVGASRVSKVLRSKQGKLSLLELPGGVYSSVVVDKNFGKVSAWSSQPAAEPIYYGENEAFICISSRPLLCALSLWERREIALSDDYVKEYLLLSYSACGSSPFVGVKTNAPENMVNIVEGKIYFSDLPEQPCLDYKGLNEDQVISCMKSALIDSCDVFEGVPGEPVFHLSGGKDSRTLLSVFSHLNMSPHAITYGKSNGAEPRIANALANVAGFKHTVLMRDLIDHDFTKASNETLRRCEGLIPSAPNQVIYSKDDVVSSVLNQPRVLGQHEIQRGGWAKLMKNNKSHVADTLNKQLSSYVSDDVKNVFFDRLSEIRAKKSFNSHVEEVYLLTHYFRSSCYLTSSILDFSRKNIPVFPMLDERFVSVCSAVAEKNIALLVSESAVFRLIDKLDSKINEIPLHEDNWRFEARKKHAEFSGDAYDLRLKDLVCHPSVPESAVCNNPSSEESASLDINTLDSASVSIIAKFVNKHIEKTGYFKDIVKPEVLEVIKNIKSGKMEEYLSLLDSSKNLKNEDVTFKKFLWRMYCATVWRTGDWLNP